MLGNPLFAVAVILESRSPGSVVIKLGLDSGTLRARSSWAAKTLRGFLLMSFPNVVVGNPLFAGAVILESRSPGSVVRRPCFLTTPLRDPRTLRAAKTLGDNSSCCCHSRKSGGLPVCRPQGEDKNSPRKKALAPKQALGRTSKKPTILCFGRVIQQICHTLRNIPPAGLLVSIQAKLRQYSK